VALAVGIADGVGVAAESASSPPVPGLQAATAPASAKAQIARTIALPSQNPRERASGNL